MRALLERSDLAGEVDSAGMIDYHVGEPPDRRSQAAAAARGYDLSPLRGRQVTEADLERFDHVWVMDRGHLNRLRARFGDRPKVRLFLEATAPEGVRAREVPDPYAGDESGFERVLDLIEAGCRAAVERWAAEADGGPDAEAPPEVRGT